MSNPHFRPIQRKKKLSVIVDNNIYRLEKTIILKPLKPSEYRLRAIQTEAIFEMHKYLDIVLGNEPNPTPVDDNGTPIGPIGQHFQDAISSWETHRGLAREALLRSLEPIDLLKLISYDATMCTLMKNSLLKEFYEVYLLPGTKLHLKSSDNR